MITASVLQLKELLQLWHLNTDKLDVCSISTLGISIHTYTI